ncbi:MAG: YidE/YbjL duplication, partial [Clostridium sp.]|nr:YidE/YbjL duplication [Clostridium sp.]
MFLSIATGLLIGRIKIKSFSLGVSGGIFTGIVIGYLTTRWAHTG